MLREQGVSEEERIKRGKELGEQDVTDFENPYVSQISEESLKSTLLIIRTVPLHDVGHRWWRRWQAQEVE